jgi:hypothetical protein
MIQVPQSYQKTISDLIQPLLDIQDIELLAGGVGGHRKDLDGYITLDGATLEEIQSMASSCVNIDSIPSQIQKKARLGPDLIKYIAKTKIPA